MKKSKKVTKKKSAKRSSPPETLENVRSLRTEIFTLNRLFNALRAELDQHKKRQARYEATTTKNLAELERRVNSIENADIPPVEVNDLPGYEEQHVFGYTDEPKPISVTGEWGGFIERRINQLGGRINGLEGDIYNAQKSLVPPEGCEIVVRRSR